MQILEMHMAAVLQKIMQAKPQIGTVIWVFSSEIFPNRVRARGQALGSFTHWFMCAIVSWTFPIIASISGGYAFAFFATMMVLQLLFVIFLIPETKGIPLEQIQKKLRIE
jgi:MFS transporter, SP family, xylose:H+ symportor